MLQQEDGKKMSVVSLASICFCWRQGRRLVGVQEFVKKNVLICTIYSQTCRHCWGSKKRRWFLKICIYLGGWLSALRRYTVSANWKWCIVVLADLLKEAIHIVLSIYIR